MNNHILSWCGIFLKFLLILPPFLPVRGEDDAPALSHDASDGVPEEASGGRVHSRGGFVQEQDGRVTHKCYGRAQLPLVAATGQHINSRDFMFRSICV